MPRRDLRPCARNHFQKVSTNKKGALFLARLQEEFFFFSPSYF